MSWYFGAGALAANGSCHMVRKSPFRYAMTIKGSSVKGTRYNKAGWAALNTCTVGEGRTEMKKKGG